MKSFAEIRNVQATVLEADHEGRGPIEFRRYFERADFRSPIDFVDFTIVPPGSEIGVHEHRGNDELYLIAEGNPEMRIDGRSCRLEPGSVAVVRSGQTHGLVNDTAARVVLFVVQVRYPPE